MKILCLAFFFPVFLAFPSGLHGRTAGKIEGYVRDADTGVSLVGAEVYIKGAHLRGITNEKGYYLIPNVPFGLEDVRARLAGYRSVVVKKQGVFSGLSATIDFELEPAIVEIPSRFIAEAVQPLLLGMNGEHIPRGFLRSKRGNTTRCSFSSHFEDSLGLATGSFDDERVSKAKITTETIRAIPADSYRDMVTLQAGVVRYGDAEDPEYPISIRGGRVSENAVFIDGIDVRRYHTDQNLLDVPEFGVEEIDVNTGGYGTAYGGAQSGVIHIITREGGSDLSGQLRFETEEFNPSSSNYGYNRFEFSTGGPVPKVEGLTFFFSGDLIGKGDRRPRAAGFKGTTEDLFDVAKRFSNNSDVGEFLGHDLDITGMLRTAQRRNAGLPALNLTDLRRARFGGKDFEGRLPGDRGDEYRIQGKLAFRPVESTRLTATYLEDRDQGIVFDRRRIFWTEERNQGYVNRNRLGIFGYERVLSRLPERSFRIAIRGSHQRFERHTGDLFAPFDSTSARIVSPGASMGYDERYVLLNFMPRDIPIFDQDLWTTGFDFEQNDFFEGVIQANNHRADNPFGIMTSFYDQNKGYNDVVFNAREDRTELRFDLDGRFNHVHRLRAGLELKTWRLDQYSRELSSASSLDFYRAEPDMESFYIEDRLEHQEFIVDLGLRLDSFNAARYYPSTFGDQDADKVKPSRKSALAPRIGIVHPVSGRISLWGGLGIHYQVPQFTSLYRSINFDVDQQGNASAIFGNPDLDFRKTTSFELGFSTLLSGNWALDLVGYNREFDRNVAARYIRQEGSSRFLKVYTNDGFGDARGLDITLRKGFRDYFSADLAYSLTFSRSTDPDMDDFVQNEGYWAGGDWPPSPPGEPAPNDYDQTHTFNTLFNLTFPDDFLEGTKTEKILGATGFFFTFQAHSGRPYTRQDPQRFFFIEENNSSRTDWQSMANVRVTRDFTIGGLDYTVFADIRNLFDTDNLSAFKSEEVSFYNGAAVTNGVYQTTGSPLTDGNTVNEALDYLGITAPDMYIDPGRRAPADIDGDGDRDEEDQAEIIRRLDMNGDGRVTLDEELAMAILSIGAYDADPENFDIPRLFRLGLEVRF